MELGNNKPKDFGNKEIKPPQTEVQKQKIENGEKSEQVARYNAIYGPVLGALNSFDQQDQIVSINKQDQSTIPTNYEAETIPDPWEGSYKTGNEAQTQLPQLERQSTVYNLSREQLAYVNSQDKFVQKQEPRIYNSTDEVFEQMVKDWEVAYGVEPIPKASGNFDNIDEINEVIDRNWKTKFANYKARQPKAEPEVKEVLRKRDKIKNVIKNVGNRIKDKLQEWYDKIDIKIEDDEDNIDFNEMYSPNFYIDNNTESNYSDEEINQAIEILEAEDQEDELDQEAQELKTDPEVVYKGRKNLEDILVSSKPSAWKEDTEPNSNAGWRTVKPNEVIAPEVVAGRAKLDNLKVSGKPAEKLIEQAPEPNESSIEEVENSESFEMDEFTETQMLKFESVNSEEDIESAIKDAQSEILDLAEEDVLESNIKKIKTLNVFIKSYKDKKEIVKKDLKELTESKGLIFDSRSFEVINKNGKLFAKVKNDKIAPNEQYPVTIDEIGKLKFTGDGGKNYAVNDIKYKIINQKLEESSNNLKVKLAKL
jgi:hypothetical protein